jgi:hypothetical protein
MKYIAPPSVSVAAATRAYLFADDESPEPDIAVNQKETNVLSPRNDQPYD